MGKSRSIYGILHHRDSANGNNKDIFSMHLDLKMISGKNTKGTQDGSRRYGRF